MPSRAVPFTGESVSRYLASLKKWKENRDWRTKETEAGRPSTFEDYCRAHGLCPACAASGITRNENGTGFKAIGWNGKVQLFEECFVCGGTGKITVPS
jgi:DnaJ-class molecular chaperone